ncbi:hypothetical protein [Granulicella sp. WH15]|uniref:alpha/beta fold hydrolase n=1 Tax=Granulicella sp. WH15 TaxID=2602070 RepID=UPI0015F2E534|nr:hypothetical protein [Granulicella sp. WH15]
MSVPISEERPTWYVVANNDRAIAPALEVTMAKRMKAATLTLQSGHLSMLSHPAEVSSFEEKAACSLGALKQTQCRFVSASRIFSGLISVMDRTMETFSSIEQSSPEQRMVACPVFFVLHQLIRDNSRHFIVTG